MINKLHVTIGIPAYNEEANIGRLLKSLYRQTQDSFVLDKILVVCDGPTDETVRIVQKFSKRYGIVICLNDPIRRGVRFRTQQIINISKSDVLVFFDGDTLPQDINTLDQLVGVFNDSLVQLASARIKPLQPITKFEYMHFAWRSVWSALTEKWRGGNNIYNFRGVGIAIRRDFSKYIRLPENITSASSHFIYLSAKQRSLKTTFCSTAVIHYRLAKSLKDYLLQLNRGRNDSHILKNMFPKIYQTEYVIPKKLILYVILIQILYKPIETIIGLAFYIVTPLIQTDTQSSDHNGIWDIAKSTKTLVSKN